MGYSFMSRATWDRNYCNTVIFRNLLLPISLKMTRSWWNLICNHRQWHSSLMKQYLGTKIFCNRRRLLLYPQQRFHSTLLFSQVATRLFSNENIVVPVPDRSDISNIHVNHRNCTRSLNSINWIWPSPICIMWQHQQHTNFKNFNKYNHKHV